MASDGSSRSKAIRILIAENIPSLNKGEMAIMGGILESFKVLDDTNVSMLSDLVEIDSPRYSNKVDVIDIYKSINLPNDLKNRSNYFKLVVSLSLMARHAYFSAIHKLLREHSLKLIKSSIWREYLSSDIILIGHNGTFGPGWGMFRTPIFFYYFYMPFFAKSINKKIILYGGSVGNYDSSRWLLRKWAKYALNSIDLITLREEISYRNLRNLDVKNENVFLLPDLAFLLNPSSQERVEEIMHNEGITVEKSKPILGITVTREIACSCSSYEEHVILMAQIIDALIDKYNFEIVFVPHCIGYEKELDDRLVAGDICQKCKYKLNIRMITEEYDAEELKGLLGRFDLFIGERIHSVINAISMGVPSIALLYSKDMRLNILKLVGQEDAIFYVDGLKPDSLIAKIEDVWLNRISIRERICQQSLQARSQASYNSKLLKKLVERMHNHL